MLETGTVWVIFTGTPIFMLFFVKNHVFSCNEVKFDFDNQGRRKFLYWLRERNCRK